MKCNVGKKDRIARAILGLVIIGLGVFFQSWWGLIGLVPLVTAIFKFCPLYFPFNINTSGE